MEHLQRTLKGYELGLRIHGRPLDRIQADAQAWEDVGVAVNSEFLLAACFQADYGVEDEPFEAGADILFAPLGE